MQLHPQDLALLNDYQHHFPLVERPFDAIAQELYTTEQHVLQALRAGRRAGHISRIGAVWRRGAGGAAALCALKVPYDRLPAVADAVSHEFRVTHNYQRDHEWNLWYVVTARDEAAVRETADRIAQAADVPALFLPMVRAYRVDLAFDLRARHAAARPLKAPEPQCDPVAPWQQPLAALAEHGMPLIPRPYNAWARHLGWPADVVLRTLHQWKAHGTLRRFGVVVRHHGLGFDSNAMTVVNAPARLADEIGLRIGAQPGVTLAYRRVPAEGWPYNLYFMVHGRERPEVRALVRSALAAAGASNLPHETLFSVRRFKQTGGRYFAEPLEAA
ncbi:siroheme decarboxylase subunit beta [Ramlibacter albus]|uniref:siroheme decarboxylase n=1 Tax=Ramlibacter albus TaxID=2079448 RepID=A0A923MA10_9BURK|nr:Lrp/AsnC family transcriptional regulator [Ramlibacter albus]MBC5765641.1 Lrp/AsnC family transcriptional regulator [Ramlibacter albus]